MSDIHDTEILEENEAPLAEILDPVDSGRGALVVRAEIDQQVSTAKRYPRDLKSVKATVMSLATLDEATAEECIYALPRGGKAIKGASARFADLLMNTWGNCRTDSYVTEINREDKFVEAVGVFIDVERNIARRRRVRRRIVDSKGRLYNPDMILMTGNAACSIAERNAILAGVPKVIWHDAYDRAYALVAGTVQTLAEKREKAIKAFARYGVTPEQVFAALDIKNESEIDVDDIPTLRGMLSALKSGEETVESMFAKPAEHTKVVNPLAESDAGPTTTAAPANTAAGQRVEGGSHDTVTSPPAGSREPASNGDAKHSTPSVDGGASPDTQSPTHQDSNAGSAPTGVDAGAGAPATDRRTDKGGAPAQLFTEYADACARATQPRSLGTISDQFWNSHEYPEDEPSKKKLQDIHHVHVRRIKGEFTAKQAADEIKALIA